MIALHAKPHNPALQLTYLLNLERLKIAMPVLKNSPKLIQSAAFWIFNMAQEKHFQFQAPSGLTIDQVVTAQQAHWNKASVILHKGEINPESALNAILENTKNKQALLNPNFTQVGIAQNPDNATWIILISDYPLPAWLRYQPLHQKRKP